MIKIDDQLKIYTWYRDWDESMLWSCFQKIMGEVYVDHLEHPQSGIVYVNCFAFAAGKPNKLLVQNWYDEKVSSFAIITARDDSWDNIFKAVGHKRFSVPFSDLHFYFFLYKSVKQKCQVL